MSHATGTFTVKDWDESTYSELGETSKLTKATMTFAFDGDLEGEGISDAIMYYRPDGTAVYTGYQQTTGSLDGRDGSFVLLAEGEYVGGEARTRWQILEGSGTGGLAGLTGTGESVATDSPPGTFTLDYTLG